MATGRINWTCDCSIFCPRRRNGITQGPRFHRDRWLCAYDCFDNDPLSCGLLDPAQGSRTEPTQAVGTPARGGSSGRRTINDLDGSDRCVGLHGVAGNQSPRWLNVKAGQRPRKRSPRRSRGRCLSQKYRLYSPTCGRHAKRASKAGRSRDDSRGITPSEEQSSARLPNLTACGQLPRVRDKPFHGFERFGH